MAAIQSVIFEKDNFEKRGKENFSLSLPTLIGDYFKYLVATQLVFF